MGKKSLLQIILIRNLSEFLNIINLRLPQLLEMIRATNDPGLLDRAPGGLASIVHLAQQRQFDDPPGLHDKASYLLRHWVDLYHSPSPISSSFTKFVQQVG